MGQEAFTVQDRKNVYGLDTVWDRRRVNSLGQEECTYRSGQEERIRVGHSLGQEKCKQFGTERRRCNF